MAIEKDTWTATGVDADMPAYRMLLTLCAYIFARPASGPQVDALKVARPRLSPGRDISRLFTHLVLGLLIGALVGALFPTAAEALYVKAVVSVSYLLGIALLFRRGIVIWLIRLYQFRAPAEIRAKCMMVPCCSEYMILAIDKHGLIAGVSKGIARLRRCGPLAQTDYP